MRTCKKCGAIDILISYNKETDMIDGSCEICEYEWSEKPLDRKEKNSYRKGDSEVWIGKTINLTGPEFDFKFPDFKLPDPPDISEELSETKRRLEKAEAEVYQAKAELAKITVEAQIRAGWHTLNAWRVLLNDPNRTPNNNRPVEDCRVCQVNF